MKTLKFFLVGMMLILAGASQGQYSSRVHVGTPPPWGPAGYNNVRYYYLPDIEAYYDVRTAMFIYLVENRWVRSHYLPHRYRNYDLYHGYKVPMRDYYGDAPYSHFRDYRMRYSKGYHGGYQRTIREGDYRDRREHVVIQPNRPAVRVIDRHQDRVIDRHQERVIDRHPDRVIDRHEGRIYDRHSDRVIERHPDRVIDRHSDRVIDRHDIRDNNQNHIQRNDNARGDNNEQQHRNDRSY
jgi:hypothetical protein